MKILILGCVLLAASGAKVDTLTGHQQPTEEFFQRTRTNNLVHVQHGIQGSPVSTPSLRRIDGQFQENRDQFSHRQDQDRAELSQQQQGNRRQFSQQQQEDRTQFSDRQQQTRDQFSLQQQENRDQFSQRNQEKLRQQAMDHFSVPRHDFFLQRQENIFSKFQDDNRRQFSQERQDRFQDGAERQQFSQHQRDMMFETQQELRPQFSQDQQGFISQRQQELTPQFSQHQQDRFSQRQEDFRPQLSQHQGEVRPEFMQRQQQDRDQFTQQQQRDQFSRDQQTFFPENQQERFSQRQQDRKDQFSQHQQEIRPHFSQRQQERFDQTFNQQQESERSPSLGSHQTFSSTSIANPNLVDIKYDDGSIYQFHFSQNTGSRKDQTSQSRDASRPLFTQNIATRRSQERRQDQQPTSRIQSQQIHSSSSTLRDSQQGIDTTGLIQTTELQAITGHIESAAATTVLGVFQPFFVPRTATLAEGEVSSTFTCSQFGQGHYTDPESQCRMFHVCTPVRSPSGAQTSQYRFTFRCGEGEQFDQKTLTCASSTSSSSCPSSLTTFFKLSSTSSPSSSPSSSPAFAHRLFSDFPARTPTETADVCYLAKDFIITGIRRK